MPRRRVSAREDLEESDAEAGPSTQRRRISEADVDQSYGEDGEEQTQGDHSNQEQMVKNLVRLALACEYTRAPLRRTDINTRVMGSHSRQFKAVFAQAQLQLRQVFGMELVELPVKDKVTLQQKRAAAKSQYQKEARAGGSKATQLSSQAPQQSSNAWILTTVLPEKLRGPDILPPPRVPTTEAESQYTALSSFIVSIIVLSGGTLPENKLERYLTRANVNEITPFTNSLVSGALDKTDKLLKKMEKDGFIVRVRDTSGGDEMVDYVVGPRGKVEVGKEGVEGLVKAVYGEVEDVEDFEARLKRSLGRMQTGPQEESEVTTS